jgi:flagellar FliL protein
MSAQAAQKQPAAAAAGKEGADKPEGGGKKKSKLLFIIIGVVVLLGGGAGAFFAFKHKTAAPVAAADAAQKDDKADSGDKSGAKKAPPQFYKFDPAFVVNFGGEGSARYLQITVEAMARDAAILEELKTNEPAVRNDLVTLFSSQDNATLMTSEGKEKLRQSTLDVIRKILNGEGQKGKGVEAVYFTSFVIQ